MKKSTTINLDTKSQLAKLIATENIIIQHNNVSTASFNTKTRVLTLPIFKESHGDVYDMLIAHECAHALFTPQDGWKKIQDDDELRTYVNVLEDTRIDKKIQKKYPGVVRNYINGFDILEKQNFFGMNNKDLNKELMLIDKINLRSKSSNRIPFIFTPDNNNWLAKVDAIKTFADVVRVAKDMLNWQKKQVEQMKKLPDFDDHPLIKNYELSDEDSTDPEDKKEQDDDINVAYYNKKKTIYFPYFPTNQTKFFFSIQPENTNKLKLSTDSLDARTLDSSVPNGTAPKPPATRGPSGG